MEINRGTKVLVYRRVEKEEGWHNGWANAMNYCIGQWATVERNYNNDPLGVYAKVGFNTWGFPPSSVLTIESLRAYLKVGMRVRVIGSNTNDPDGFPAGGYAFPHRLLDMIGKEYLITHIHFGREGAYYMVNGTPFLASNLMPIQGIFALKDVVKVSEKGHTFNQKYVEVVKVDSLAGILTVAKRGKKKEVKFSSVTKKDDKAIIQRIQDENEAAKEPIVKELDAQIASAGRLGLPLASSDFAIQLEDGTRDLHVGHYCFGRISAYAKKHIKTIGVSFKRVDMRLGTDELRQDYRKYLDFVLFRSVWKDMYINPISVDNVFENGLYIRTDVPPSMAMISMIACRQGWEYRKSLPTFTMLVEEGIKEEVAFILSYLIHKDDGEYYLAHNDSSHTLFNGGMTIKGVSKFMKNGFTEEHKDNNTLQQGNVAYRIFRTIDKKERGWGSEALGTLNHLVSSTVSNKQVTKRVEWADIRVLSEADVVEFAKGVEIEYDKA